MHARRLLDAAQGEGLLRCEGDGAVVLQETGRAEIESLYATQIIRLLIAAAKTIGERPKLASHSAPAPLAAPVEGR